LSSPDELARLKARVEVYSQEIKDLAVVMQREQSDPLKEKNPALFLGGLLSHLESAVVIYAKTIGAYEAYVKELERFVQR